MSVVLLSLSSCGRTIESNVDALRRLRAAGYAIDLICWHSPPPEVRALLDDVVVLDRRDRVGPSRRSAGEAGRWPLAYGERYRRRAGIDLQRHLAWRVLRCHSRALELIGRAGTVVAVDMTSTLAAWRLTRRHPSLLALNGLSEAATRLTIARD
jgi:hypothetical protein